MPVARELLTLDLGSLRFDRTEEVRLLPSDLAVLMVSVAARQAASPTAAFQARISLVNPQATLLAPLDGAFNGPVATALMTWREP